MKGKSHIQIILKLASIQITFQRIIDYSIILTKQNIALFSFPYGIFFLKKRKIKFKYFMDLDIVLRESKKSHIEEGNLYVIKKIIFLLNRNYHLRPHCV